MDKRLTTHGTTIHYTDTGEGPRTVILMHGWGCSCSTVESIRALLAPSHRVITVDLPGHGSSEEPPERPDRTPWGIEEYTRVIEELARHENISRPILIGHSFGGRISILYASRNDVDRVVLVDSAGIRPRRPFRYYWKVYTFKFAKWAALTFMGKKRGQARVDAMRARRGSADYRQASPMMRRILAKCVNEDLRDVMPLIKAPTLLMWGENDTATPLDDARKMNSLIPDSGIVTFARCGHYCFLDNPSAFATVLSKFVSN